ncbi:MULTISPECIES: type IV restriction endonuclease McrA [Streptomyces]|uniref:HNH nuclease domain-containing protein n=1 Tax=Streptomyces coelicolor (strain ATCC BAA-471 / A3(2) / M145) TaxID=100226 RepID=Q9L0M9_STRCO|nr:MULTISPECIES: type IV restriction endonuclease McrA [Streptomyces]MDX2929820.1 type IV restriction endonuclease McrA [Streptomyces sp. NRRL_B-16638]MYU44151.1 HNH endonuclease [Streptomyces sp. SID7813]NSL81543.1 HNH endonuclease [Streptomyces coelicolor]QFI44567.1 HNH endonuclease [Streptomyces coelicolor A3(2)]QKN68196.1 HNH endonuclease [Streptomyces coelicolor]
MAPSEITRAGILQAIAEHDRIGPEAFRATYGFHAATSYFLEHEGRLYDSKAIAGVAHMYDFGVALKPSSPGLSGGLKHAVAWLRREGFTIREAPKTFHRRVGDVRPARRAMGPALHRPVLLLWAIGQAVARAPRLQPWSTTRDAVAPLMEKYGQVEDGVDGVRYPFWALVRDDLWCVEQAEELTLTSRGRRPTLESLNAVDPSAGLREDDYNLLRSQPEAAASAAAGLIARYFHLLPAGLLEDFGLHELLAGRWPDALRPLLGETFKDRDAIWRAYGGQKMAGIGCLADGILSAFSDDKGPYADGRIPDTTWIAYVGDGLSGDQKLTDGNELMAEHQAVGRALRYWHKPFQGQWSFETWAVIVQRRLRWGLGEDKLPRREFLWVLAPVPSPERETWPPEVLEALEADTGELHDDTGDYRPSDLALTPGAPDGTESDDEAYRRLAQKAEANAERRGQLKKPTVADKYVRDPSARGAVLKRCQKRCENPECAGHPTELTKAGLPILQVDHVNDLAKGGPDVPWNMIALCPNCHALKTYGANKVRLQRLLAATARRLHEEKLQ